MLEVKWKEETMELVKIRNACLSNGKKLNIIFFSRENACIKEKQKIDISALLFN